MISSGLVPPPRPPPPPAQPEHTHLIARPASEAVRVELVDMEDVDGALDAEVMQLAAHFQVQQVILRG